MMKLNRRTDKIIKPYDKSDMMKLCKRTDNMIELYKGIVLKGKAEKDQDYKSEHISVMVATQDFRVNQEDYSWKGTMVGTEE